MTKSELVEILHKKIYELCTQDNKAVTKLILPGFNLSVFSENFQSFEFYEKEMLMTLKQIQEVDEKDTALLYFLSEKLLSQYEMIFSYFSHKTKRSPALSQSEKDRIHQLPPRERLDKYYEALNQLNQKIAELEALHSTSPTMLLAQRLAHQKQRRDKCLDAIELLEEYLAFKQENRI